MRLLSGILLATSLLVAVWLREAVTRFVSGGPPSLHAQGLPPPMVFFLVQRSRGPALPSKHPMLVAPSGAPDSASSKPMPQDNLSRRWSLPWLCGALVLLESAYGAAPACAIDKAGVATVSALPTRELVVDATNVIAPSTRKYLDKVLRRLQEDTGLKVRVICPPSGIQGDREQFRTYLRPINKELGIDPMSLVIVAEQRVSKEGRILPLLSIQSGFRLQERFQYRLTQDFLAGAADKFGFPKYFEAKGTDTAIQEATENVAAALYNLVDDKTSRYYAPLPPEEVTAILKRHSL